MAEINGVPLPRYRNADGHEVSALKIHMIVLRLAGGPALYPADLSYAPIAVDQDFIDTYQPQDGGYYIVEDDGLVSWAEAEDFEAQYTEVPR